MSSAAEKRKEFVNKVAHDIIAMIQASEQAEEGDWMSWAKPFGKVPFNPTTGRQYSGMNLITLMCQMKDRGINDPRFLGYKQAQGWAEDSHVRPNSKSYKIVIPIFKKKERDETDDLIALVEDSDKKDSRSQQELVGFVLNSVFSAVDIENAPMPDLPPRKWKEDNQIINLLEASGCEVVHGAYSPHYQHNDGKVYMPLKKAFETQADYNAILMHEWYHWTGHEDREDRYKERSIHGADITQLKAQEELRAQIFSLTASQMLGIPTPDTKYHASYINHFLEILDKEPKQIITAATQAAKMVEVAMDVLEGIQPKAKWFPDRATWPSSDNDAPQIISAEEYFEEYQDWDSIVEQYFVDQDMSPEEKAELAQEIRTTALSHNLNILDLEDILDEKVMTVSSHSLNNSIEL